ncbi:MAG TPA: hypothetical protein VIX19_10000 [Terriglobales bacterium]
MMHTNFTPIGRKNATFPGAIVPDDSVNGAAEWAYGVAPWFEQGLYLPVYSLYSTGRHATISGFKIRELFVRPHAHDHNFFYASTSNSASTPSIWEPKRITSKLRPIVGLHLHRADLIYNPIVDTNYTGGFGNLEFVPAGRVAYNLNDKWAVAAEEYADFGPPRHFLPLDQQFHEVWAAMDHNGEFLNVKTGVSFGLTSGADKLPFKLMLSRDLNRHPCVEHHRETRVLALGSAS